VRNVFGQILKAYFCGRAFCLPLFCDLALTLALGSLFCQLHCRVAFVVAAAATQ